MQCTYIVINRHVIIVEDNKQVVGGVGYIVESLECKTVSYRSIPDKSHSLTVFFGGGIKVGSSHAESRGNGIAGMTADKSIIFALGGEGETTYAVERALCLESLTASGQQFVGISLMSYIKDYAVAGGIEDVM